jgi:putative transcriptional regulator
MITNALHPFLGTDSSLRLLVETQGAILGTTGFDTFGNPLWALHNGIEAIEDAIGGAAFEAEDPVGVGPHFFKKVMATITALEAKKRRSHEAAHAAGQALQEILDLPQPLRDVSLEAVFTEGWSFAGPGVKTMKLNTGSKLTTRLMRIEPGFGAPNHDHTGTEYTLVVCGAFEDDTGYFGPGNLSIKRPGDVHHPVAVAGNVCIALAVEEGDIALTGPLGMLQRLFTRH